MSTRVHDEVSTKNKLAIRCLCRFLDILTEQADEIRYAHKGHEAAYESLRIVRSFLREAKSELSKLSEESD